MKELKHKFDKRLIKSALCITNGNVNKGFGQSAKVFAYKKGTCKLIGDCPELSY
jgi:hypothetical protein